MKRRGNKKRTKLLSDKGVAQMFYVLLIVLVGIIVGESVYLQNYIANTDFMKRSVRETAIIESINTMEFVKKFMKEALSLSFYKSSYDVLGSEHTTGGSNGGFCCYDNSCDVAEECKIPLKVGDTYIPTHKCQPWWRIYEDVYAPDTDAFIDYLENRTAKIYQTYKEDLEEQISKATIPDYCPVDKTNPPGNITIEDFAGSSGIEDSETGAIRLNASNNYGEPLTYKDVYLEITEPNSFFSDKFAVSTLDLFKIARHEFAEDDWVEEQFDEGDKGMPNTWCEMVGEYCNMTADCWTYRDRFEQKTNCWGSDCCCRAMHFGDMCESDLPDCDSKLSNYCYKEDKTKSDPCNLDRNSRSESDATIVSANEKYNCTMLERLGTYETPKVTEFGDGGWVESTTRIENCIIPGHESEQLESGRIDVKWTDPDGNDPNSEKCKIVGRDGFNCGCEDECTHGEGCQKPSCKDDGSCPDDAVIAAACPPDNCGYYSGCSDSCIKYECDYSESNPCSVLTGCEGQCSLSGGSCVYNPECSEPGASCSCSEVWSPYTSCGPGRCEWGDCIKWDCSFDWSCANRANACGYECCELTYAYVKDVRCNYDYIGTANISAVVSDVKNSYPIDSEWKGLGTAFYVASGNTDKGKCPAMRTDDDPSTTTVENPEWQYCRCKT